jgi:cytochrome d ubiquinol oxidase subunit I
VYWHQPAKLAAFEGHYRTGPADLNLVGVPDDDAESVRFSVGIPGGLSFLVHDDLDAPVVGLDRFRHEDRPPVLLSFASYHVMIGLGMLFIGLTLLAALLHWRRRLFSTRWLLWVFVFAVVGPVIANELGWVAAEVGRQPWIVHPPVRWTPSGDVVVGPEGVVDYDENLGLRTSDAVSPAVDASQVLGSMIGFGLIYASLLAVWLYVLDSKIRHGPEPVEPLPEGDRGSVLAAAARRQQHSDSLTGSEDAG